MDHIVAFDNNGPDAEYNIVPSCPSCNNSKRKKQPADYVAWRYKRGLPLHPQFLEPGGELKKAIEFKGGREYNYLPAL
jgi:5-methylcytosine-specific restriction endonuclease McrA